MPEIIDLCGSDDDDDLPTVHISPKKSTQKRTQLTQHTPPKPTNASGTVRLEPRKGIRPPSDSANSLMSRVTNGSRAQNGVAASTSTRSPSKVSSNGEGPAKSSSSQRSLSISSLTSKSDRDRPLAAGASRDSRSTADNAVFKHYKFSSNSSSHGSAQSPSSSASAQERGHKRGHNADSPRSNGSRSLNFVKQTRISGLGGNTPSTKASSTRAAESSKMKAAEKSAIIDLTQDDDEDERPAKKSRNNDPRTVSSDSLPSSSGPARPLSTSKGPEHQSRPPPAPSLSNITSDVGPSQPVRNSSHQSPQGKASKGLDVTMLSSSSPRLVHPSVERSFGTQSQASAVPVASSSHTKATSFSQKSCNGSTPTKSRDSSQRSMVGKTSSRLSEVRERRSTIPESPPLSPIVDNGSSVPSSSTSRPANSSSGSLARLKARSQPNVGRDSAEGSPKGSRQPEEEETSKTTPSDSFPVMAQSSKPSEAWIPDHASKSKGVIPPLKLDSPRKENNQSDASSGSTTANEHRNQANPTGLTTQSLEVTRDFEALLQSDAHAQHTQAAKASPQRSKALENARAQDQQAAKSSKTPSITLSSQAPTLKEPPLVSVQQPARPKSKLSLLNRNVQRADSTNSSQLASGRDVPLASAQTTGFHSIERAVGQYVEEMRSDNEHWTRVELQRARVSNQRRTSANNTGKATSVFARMTPIPLRPLHRKGVPGGCAKLITELHPLSSKTQRNSYYAQYTTYDTSNTVQVPNYNHYVSISNNLLANNVTSLQHWPYFGDDFDLNEALNLNKEYYIDVDDRERKLLRLGQSEGFAPYAEDLIRGVGCEWSDVLYFLLELEPDVGMSVDARKALRDRQSFISEDFIRDGERWGKVLERLPRPSPYKVGRAAVLCDHFQRIAKFSFWHMVRRSTYTKQLIEEAVQVRDESQLTCRVCMRFNCPYHGEIRDHPRGQGPADNQIVETDIILPQVVNYRTRVPFPPTVDSTPAAQGERRTLEYWEKGPFGNLKWKADERDPFYPCHHPGISCSNARCSCFDARIACEKSCSCGPGCNRKWKGCSCHSGKRPKGKTVCWEDERCACWQLSRECDPDLCGDCGVADVLDPVHRHDDRILQNRCRLASLQRGVAKHTIIGDSGVHGLGLYACEDIWPDDFVGEYKGETITKEEAERRGAVYEHQKLSYLFTLNQKQEVDSTYFGNKIRFINHVQESKANLKPAITMVNTVFRIGMYAKKKIRAGEEFFFDYGPSFPRDQLDGNKQSKSAPRARVNPQNFHEIDLVRDQEGHVRATKKATGTGSGSSEDGEEDIPRRPGRPHGSLNKRRTISDTSSSGSKRLGGAGPGTSRTRKALRSVDEVESEDIVSIQVDEKSGLDDVAEASSDDYMEDAEHRLTMYHVLEGSAEDEEFEPEEDSLSEADMMSAEE